MGYISKPRQTHLFFLGHENKGYSISSFVKQSVHGPETMDSPTLSFCDVFSGNFGREFFPNHLKGLKMMMIQL